MGNSGGNAAADTEVKSSFNTLRNTIYHIYDAQYVWFLRVQNQPLLHWPPSSNFNYTLAQFDIVLQQQSNDWLQFIATLKPNEFEQTIVYTNTKNQPFETTHSRYNYPLDKPWYLPPQPMRLHVAPIGF
jgi:uncharacterized damage-inducible protein DinB